MDNWASKEGIEWYQEQRGREEPKPRRSVENDPNVPSSPPSSLANHVASIESLKPGVLEVIEGNGESKKWFGTFPLPLPW